MQHLCIDIHTMVHMSDLWNPKNVGVVLSVSIEDNWTSGSSRRCFNSHPNSFFSESKNLNLEGSCEHLVVDKVIPCVHR